MCLGQPQEMGEGREVGAGGRESIFLEMNVIHIKAF